MQNLRTPLIKQTTSLLRSFSQSPTIRLLSSEASAQESVSAPPKVKRWGWSAILLFIPGLSAFGLGTWQLMRREWKVEVLEHRRNRLRDDIVPLHLALSLGSKDGVPNSGGLPEDNLQSLEYRRVQCDGTYAEDKSLFLGPRGRTHHGVTERGYFLITPLLPVAGDDTNLQVPVLVNRGWVPGSWRDNPPQQPRENIQEDSPSVDEKNKSWFLPSSWGKKQEVSKVNYPKVEAVKVTGVIRDSENPNMFVPSNEPSRGQWFFVDVPAMARAAGLPENTIYVEALQDKMDEFKGKQYPDPKNPEALIKSSVMPHDHLSYAFTWYTLSAATTFMAWKRLSK